MCRNDPGCTSIKITGDAYKRYMEDAEEISRKRSRIDILKKGSGGQPDHSPIDDGSPIDGGQDNSKEIRDLEESISRLEKSKTDATLEISHGLADLLLYKQSKIDKKNINDRGLQFARLAQALIDLGSSDGELSPQDSQQKLSTIIVEILKDVLPTC